MRCFDFRIDSKRGKTSSRVTFMTKLSISINGFEMVRMQKIVSANHDSIFNNNKWRSQGNTFHHLICIQKYRSSRRLRESVVSSRWVIRRVKIQQNTFKIIHLSFLWIYIVLKKHGSINCHDIWTQMRLYNVSSMGTIWEAEQKQNNWPPLPKSMLIFLQFLFNYSIFVIKCKEI